jgi:GH25 family lysozyme M1 (1,4-beta-N-acetylmuramidase)
VATGIDLYQRYNDVTDWNALAAAVDFAWIKVSDGGDQPVVHADAYVTACVAHQILWGGYHFAEPGDPVSQALVFVAQLRRLGFALDRGHLAPILDIENGGIPVAQRRPFVRAFLETVHSAFGCRVGTYSSTTWLTQLDVDSMPYDWDVTWAAEYGNNDGSQHPITHYAGRVDAHQYTSRGTVAGVSGWVDLSYAADVRVLEAAAVAGEADAEVVWGQQKLYALPQNPTTAPVWHKRFADVVIDGSGASQRTESAVTDVKAMLATVLANQKDDLSSADVLAHLDASFHALVADDVLPALQAIKDAIASDAHAEADAIVDALATRLARPAQ